MTELSEAVSRRQIFLAIILAALQSLTAVFCSWYIPQQLTEAYMRGGSLTIHILIVLLASVIWGLAGVTLTAILAGLRASQAGYALTATAVVSLAILLVGGLVFKSATAPGWLYLLVLGTAALSMQIFAGLPRVLGKRKPHHLSG